MLCEHRKKAGAGASVLAEHPTGLDLGVGLVLWTAEGFDCPHRLGLGAAVGRRFAGDADPLAPPQLHQRVHRTVQLPVAIELVPLHLRPFGRRVHRQPIGQLATVDRLALPARRLQLLQPRRLLLHQPPQRRRRAGPVAGQPLGQLVHELTAALFHQRRVVGGVPLLHQALPLRRLRIQGPLPPELGRLDHLLDVPAPFLLQPAAEPVPAFQQPRAALGGRLDAEEDRQRFAPAGPERGLAVLGEEREEVLRGLALGPDGVGQQPAAQRVQLLPLVGLLLRRGRADGRRRAGGLDALGPLDLPQAGSGLLGQRELEGVAWGERIHDTIHRLAVRLWILAG